jgi:hypothetical protein
LIADDVLDAGAHGVAGEALGVGDDDGTGRHRTEDLAQRVDLSCGSCRHGPACRVSWEMNIV